MSGPPHDDFELEEIECRRCGTVFNLAMQRYYDNLCPDCKFGDNDET
jgi:Zn finger protein HypA/HybF involved in hydrogenase expression